MPNDIRTGALNLRLGCPPAKSQSRILNIAKRLAGSDHTSPSLSNRKRVELANRSRARLGVLREAGCAFSRIPIGSVQVSPIRSSIKLPSSRLTDIGRTAHLIEREMSELSIRSPPQPTAAAGPRVDLAGAALMQSRRHARYARPELGVDADFLCEGGYDRLGLRGDSPSSPLPLSAASTSSPETVNRMDMQLRYFEMGAARSRSVAEFREAMLSTGIPSLSLPSSEPSRADTSPNYDGMNDSLTTYAGRTSPIHMLGDTTAVLNGATRTNVVIPSYSTLTKSASI